MTLKIKEALDEVRPDPDLVARTLSRMEEAAPPTKRGSVVPFQRRFAALAACLLVVIGLSACVYAYRFVPVGSVYVDAAQGLALDVSRAGTVVGVEYYGAQTVPADELRGKSAGDAVALVLGTAEQNGELEADGAVSLAVYDRRDGENTSSLLAACKTAVSDSYGSLAVYATAVPASLRTEAQDAAISPGRLRLIKMVQKLDGSATVSEYRDTPVTQLVGRLVYLTSDANTAATETEKAEVRKDIGDVAGQYAHSGRTPQQPPAPAATLPVSSQETPAQTQRPQSAQTPAVTRPSGGSGTAGGTQTAAPQPSAVPSSPGTVPDGQTPSDPGGQAADPGGQSADPGGQSAMPGTQPADPGTQTSDPGTQSAQPGGQAAPGGSVQPSGGTLDEPVQSLQPGGTAQPQPGNGDLSGGQTSQRGSLEPQYQPGGAAGGR